MIAPPFSVMISTDSSSCQIIHSFLMYTSGSSNWKNESSPHAAWGCRSCTVRFGVRQGCGAVRPRSGRALGPARPGAARSAGRWKVLAYSWISSEGWWVWRRAAQYWLSCIRLWMRAMSSSGWTACGCSRCRRAEAFQHVFRLVLGGEVDDGMLSSTSRMSLPMEKPSFWAAWRQHTNVGLKFPEGGQGGLVVGFHAPGSRGSPGSLWQSCR